MPLSHVTNNPLRYTDPARHKQTECASQYDPSCSAVNGGTTGNTQTGGSSGYHGGHHGGADPGGDILGGSPPVQDDPSQKISTGTQQSDTQTSSNPSMWEVFGAVGDVAQGMFFFSLSVYGGVASCTFAGPACIIVLPIFFVTATIGLQQAVNGGKSLWHMKDPSVKPTGREVIDFFYPFLK